jgi:hypothetical protein
MVTFFLWQVCGFASLKLPTLGREPATKRNYRNTCIPTDDRQWGEGVIFRNVDDRPYARRGARADHRRLYAGRAARKLGRGHGATRALVRRGVKRLHLITLPSLDFTETMRTKLEWHLSRSK